MSKIPKGWTPTGIMVRTTNSPNGESRDAYTHPDVVGLVVNKRDDLYVVSHVRSGYFIQPGFVLPKEACDFAIALAKLTDWKRSGRELQDDAAIRGAVVQLRERLNFGKTIIMIDAPTPIELGLDA